MKWKVVERTERNHTKAQRNATLHSLHLSHVQTCFCNIQADHANKDLPDSPEINNTRQIRVTGALGLVCPMYSRLPALRISLDPILLHLPSCFYLPLTCEF